MTELASVSGTRLLRPGGQFAVYADCMSAGPSVQLYKPRARLLVGTSSAKQALAAESIQSTGFQATSIEVEFATWLPFAAPVYKISANLEDYVLVPVVIMLGDLPNRNGVAFPLSELTKFNVEHGALAYKTLVGKPMHIEHDNQDPTKAIGVIVDVSLRRVSGYGNGKTLYKLVALLALDRTKNSLLAAKIVSGEQNTYSMGAWVGTVESEPGYTCSYCGAALGTCTHLHPNEPFDFYMLNGILVFRNVKNIVFFETSSVGTPAFTTALSDRLIHWST